MDERQKMIDALQAERRGYVVRKLDKRVQAVDEALRALGVGKRETATAEPQEERAVVEAPKKRTTKRA